MQSSATVACLCLVLLHDPNDPLETGTRQCLPDAMRHHPKLAEDALRSALVEAARDPDSRNRIVRIFHEEFKRLGISAKVMNSKHTQYYTDTRTSNIKSVRSTAASKQHKPGAQWVHTTMQHNPSLKRAHQSDIFPPAKKLLKTPAYNTPFTPPIIPISLAPGQTNHRIDTDNLPLPPLSQWQDTPLKKHLSASVSSRNQHRSETPDKTQGRDSENPPPRTSTRCRAPASNDQDNPPSDISLNETNIHVVDHQQRTAESISDISGHTKTGISNIRALLNHDNNTPDTAAPAGLAKSLLKAIRFETNKEGSTGLECGAKAKGTSQVASGTEIAIMAEVDKLESTLGGYLFKGMNETRMRHREKDAGMMSFTDTVRLHFAYNEGEDFKLEVWLCSSIGKAISEALRSIADLRSILGDYIFEGMSECAGAVDVSFPNADEGSDCKVEVMLNFGTGKDVYGNIYRRVG